jgi:hypothetical protein
MSSQSDIHSLRFLNRPRLDNGEQRVEDERGEQAGDIEREDKIQREADRDLKQAVAYANHLQPLFDAICKI